MSADAPSSHTPGDFDARAATWDDDPAKVERARAIAAAIAREVPLRSAMSALEYGAGTGLLGFMLRERIGALTLADISEGMLAVAARKVAAADDPRVRTVKLDLLADPLPADRYDLIFSAMTLHHISDTAGILQRFRAALRPEGFLCVADLDTEDGSFHGAGFEGHLGFDRQVLGAQARAAGFPSVRFSTAFEMHKTGAAGARSFPIFLMVAQAG